MVKFLQRLDQEEIHREPDWSTPVRIPAEQCCRRFSGLVIDAVLGSIHVKCIRMLMMESRECANSIPRQKLTLIQHVADNPAQVFLARAGKQTPSALSLC